MEQPGVSRCSSQGVHELDIEQGSKLIRKQMSEADVCNSNWLCTACVGKGDVSEWLKVRGKLDKL